ncbi:unnamed protein product [Paramecium sonneborni]|uniref:Uncharacterized protein n=1 Tax=Paramecium sonneborni TaxID=65129 RepID=A0A8S1PCX5_9CILI|nr:unnamed protein product [Paramecium sonneborni]
MQNQLLLYDENISESSELQTIFILINLIRQDIETFVQIQNLNLEDKQKNAITKILPKFDDLKSKVKEVFENQQKSIENFSKAMDLHSKNRDDEALEYFSKSIEFNPSFIDPRLYRGKLYLDRSKNYLAELDFKQALKFDQKNKKAVKGMAVTLKLLCNYELALKYAHRTLKYDPLTPKGNFHYADCLKFLGNQKDALKYIDKAIYQKKLKQDKKLVRYYKNKEEAEIQYELNEKFQAIELLKDCLKIDPNYQQAQVLLGSKFDYFKKSIRDRCNQNECHSIFIFYQIYQMSDINIQCKNHNKPIRKVIMEKSAEKNQRLLCDLCLKQNRFDKLEDFQTIQQSINFQKIKKFESFKDFSQSYSLKLLQIEDSFSNMKTKILKNLSQISSQIEDLKKKADLLLQEDLSINIEEDIQDLLFNKWDDIINDTYKNIQKEKEEIIQKIQRELDDFKDFQESGIIKRQLEQFAQLNQNSQVTIIDDSLYLQLIDNTNLQVEPCNAISINQSGSLLATSKDTKIIIWRLENRIMNKYSRLEQIHEKSIYCLIFSQKQDSLISASEDKSICCWKRIDENKWHPSQLYQKHTGAVTCMILTENEKQLISGSTDQSLIIWDIDFNKNIIQFKSQLKSTSGDVEGLTINSQQNILASSHKNKSINIWRKMKNDQWVSEKATLVSQISSVLYGSRICFLKNSHLIWVISESSGSDYICVFQEINGKFVENLKLQISLAQNSQEIDFYLFPIIQNLQKNILIIKQKEKIYIIKQSTDNTLKIAGIIKCKSTRTSGCLSNDGSRLFFWDPNAKETGGQYFIYKI